MGTMNKMRLESDYFYKMAGKSFKYFLSFGLLAMFLTSCMSSPFGGGRDFSHGGQADGFDSSMANLKSESLYSDDSREISTLYGNILNAPAKGYDLRKINVLLLKDQRSPLEEAILAVNLMQNFVAAHERLKSEEAFEIPFKEEKMVSLAELSALYDLDLVGIIENNHFLQSVEVYHLLLKLRGFYSNDKVNRLLHESIDRKFTYFKEFVSLSASVLDSTKKSEEEIALERQAEDLRLSLIHI